MPQMETKSVMYKNYEIMTNLDHYGNRIGTYIISNTGTEKAKIIHSFWVKSIKNNSIDGCIKKAKLWIDTNTLKSNISKFIK
jgi:hypothetical protein